MTEIFYVSAVVAVISTVMVITETHPVHALLFLVMSLLAVAVMFFTLGAPFVAALEIVLYAGAVMMLFLFVIMMLNLGSHAVEEERSLFDRGALVTGGLLGAVLIVEIFYIGWARSGQPVGLREIEPKAVGTALFGPYLIGVELASLLLLGGLVGAYYLGRHAEPHEEGRE